MRHPAAAPVSNRFLTPGVFVLFGLVAMAAVVAGYRLLFGLGASTNLDNQHPWGIWIAFDVATGVALAAGGFTSAALTHIFQRHRYEAIVRPALLTAMLGYTFVVLGLMMDLGRYYNIWHPMLPMMWQGNSVLFEVGMCVMVYLNVLYLEFAPIVCERFIGNVRLPGLLAALNAPIDALLRLARALLGKVMFLFVIAGVVLSCMHQSSLGALMLIAPYKVHPLWYTPILPMLFLISAMAVGFPMVIFESILASWAFRRKPEMNILSPLSGIVVLLLGIYAVAKTCDIIIREAYVYLFDGSVASTMFLVEVTVGIAIPLALLLTKRVRRSPRLLFLASTLVVLGVAINRLNVFLVAYHPPYARVAYFPSIWEILMTIGLMSTLVLVYRICVTIFPVLPAVEVARVGKVRVLPAAETPRAEKVRTAVLVLIGAGAALAFAGQAFGADSMSQKVETGGDCSTCHTTATPSKNDLIQRKCSRSTGNTIPANIVPPDFFILDQLTDIYVPVVFPHRLHAEMESMGGNCAFCHHHSSVPGKVQSCHDCHDGGNNPDNLRQPGLKGSYHRLCLACHREWSHETDCIFCHAKRDPEKVAPATPDAGDSVGRLHPNVATPEKFVYPTPNFDTGTMVTFLHKEHTELFGERCATCHAKENCGRCHDGTAPQKHVRQDPHEDCTKCHDVSGDCTTCHSKEVSTGFDHEKRSGFMLKPYHQGIACQKCHTDTVKFAGLKGDCSGCHKPGWSPTGFDHAKSGVLALNDKHKDIDCTGCHVGGMGKPTKCNTCHDDGWKYPDKVPGTLLPH